MVEIEEETHDTARYVCVFDVPQNKDEQFLKHMLATPALRGEVMGVDRAVEFEKEDE